MSANQVEIKVFRFFLISFREPAFLTLWGRAFHSLGAVHENDPSYIAVRDFGTNSDPLSADRKLREYILLKI